jgi:N6-adenosine-specific RNA methylase IME4
MPVFTWWGWEKGLGMELITQNQQLPSTIEDLARFVLIGRDRMAAVRAEISAINRLGLAQEVRQQKLAEAQDIAEVVLDAEVKLGKLMKSELPDGRGGDRGNQYTGGKTDNADRSGKSRNDVIKELGLEERQIRRLQQLSEYPEIVAQAKVEARESSDIVSRSFVLEKIKAKEREERQNQVAEAVTPRQIPAGTFEVIYADPPWRYRFSETKSREIENQYPTMSLDDIKALDIPSADDCVLLMWATAPKLAEAIEVIAAWGFDYRTCAVWDKEKIGMGYWFRGQHELLLVGVKGEYPAPLPENRFSSVYREARGEHSAKPERYYEMIEAMFPGRTYLELFARSRHGEGWEVWGNQL